MLNYKLRGLGFRAASHFYGVCAGHDSWTLRGFKGRSCGSRHAGRLQAHRPVYAADAAPAIGRKRVYKFALRIENFNFHFSEDVALLLIVGNHPSIRTIWPVKCRAPSPPPPVRPPPLL